MKKSHKKPEVCILDEKSQSICSTSEEFAKHSEEVTAKVALDKTGNCVMKEQYESK